MYVIDPKEYFRDLKSRYIEAGVSQNQLARHAKMSPTQLSRLFRRAPDVRLSTVARLEKALVSAARAVDT